MKLANKILSILKESEEDESESENLFKPRRLERNILHLNKAFGLLLIKEKDSFLLIVNNRIDKTKEIQRLEKLENIKVLKLITDPKELNKYILKTKNEIERLHNVLDNKIDRVILYLGNDLKESKILSVLKEDKEDNLFKPRRIEDRIDKFSSLEKRIVSLRNNQIINVYIINYEKFVKGKIVEDPDIIDINPQHWNIKCNLFIPKKIVNPGDGYGIYTTRLYHFSEERNCWMKQIAPDPDNKWLWTKLKGIKEAE